MEKLDLLTIREHLIKNCGFKPFTKINRCAYAGAENFEDGSEPIIKEEEDFDIIYDRNGISFESQDESVCFDFR